MTRNEFLKQAAYAMALPSLLGGSLSAFGAPSLLEEMIRPHSETDRVLVLLFLSGGNDGLNTVIPLDQYDVLARQRKNILIPASQTLPLSGVAETALHPSLRALQGLYNSGKVRIVQAVGNAQPDYTHFGATAAWLQATPTADSGWLGRYFAHAFSHKNSPHPLAIQVDCALPQLFQYGNETAAVTLRDNQVFQYSSTEKTLRQAANLTQHITLAQQYTFPINHYPENNPLANSLKTVAQLIAGGLQTRIYAVALPGFDTHINQCVAENPTKGTHAALLQAFDTAIEAFQHDLTQKGVADRVLTVAFSEFGRSIASNAQYGTAHGAAAPVFLIGEKISGGISGNNPLLAGEKDVLAQCSISALYADLLQHWFQLSANSIQQILLNNKLII